MIFKASNVKLERAREHITELEAVLARHDADNPTKVTFTEAVGDQNAHLHVATFSPPDRVGAIVGDIIHNLRAALDLMAVQLVSLAGENTNGVCFPFCESESDLQKTIKSRNFHRAGADAVELLRELKPFKGGNAALRALHDLDIQDKHHSLIPNAAIVTSPEVTADTSTWPPTIRLVEGSMPVVVTTFPEDCPLAGEEMLPTLHKLIELVAEIVERFARVILARA